MTTTGLTMDDLITEAQNWLADVEPIVIAPFERPPIGVPVIAIKLPTRWFAADPPTCKPPCDGRKCRS